MPTRNLRLDNFFYYLNLESISIVYYWVDKYFQHKKVNRYVDHVILSDQPLKYILHLGLN